MGLYMSIQEAFGRKLERQKRIKELKYHALGACVHIGKISPGCITCYRVDPFHENFNSGIKCNARCIYCLTRSDAGRHIVTYIIKPIREVKKRLLQASKLSCYNPLVYSFTGQGDPLVNIGFVSEITQYIHKLTKHLKRKPWLYLYTNGILCDKEMILKLKDLGFDEIRFHLGASNFSKMVYKHIEMAVNYFKAITIETPAWPPHRKRLFKMLPIIDDIGVKHLNLGEIELNRYNFKRVLRAFPKARIYPCYEIHLYDEGLAYDIIEEVIRKKYSYSVLDCSCFAKLITRGKARIACFQDLQDLTDPTF